MVLRQIPNPNRKLALGFGVAGAVGLLVGILGFMADPGTGLAVGIIGLVLALTGGIAAPMLHVSGRKHVLKVEALLRGEGLRVHWTFDPDEWDRYTENEYARGIKQTRTVSFWTFAITLLLVVGVAWFSDALTALTLGIALAISLGLAAILAASAYLMTRSAYTVNRAGVGEVYVGDNGIYFGGRYHTWQGAWAKLEKVAFEPGDPSVVQFDIKYGAGDNTSHVEVRVPVPRGQEGAAQELVVGYYAAR